MSGIKLIREYFGLTQKELSIFLNISGSMMRMAETNKRILPIHAFVKLSQLDAHMQKPITHFKHKAITTRIQKHTPQHTKHLHAHHKELLYQTVLHKKKIDAMQTKYTQALQALTLVHTLQKKLPNNLYIKKI